MKLVIRGISGTGKTSLWQRLQGKPLMDAYAATPEIQIANINWSFKNMEEAVKVEVWDVVDVGRKTKPADGATVQAATATAHSSSGPPPGGVSFGTLDATVVDVYQNAQAVIFMVNPASPESYDYVVEQITSATFPQNLAVLVLVNFRDLSKDENPVSSSNPSSNNSTSNDNKENNGGSESSIGDDGGEDRSTDESKGIPSEQSSNYDVTMEKLSSQGPQNNGKEEGVDEDAVVEEGKDEEEEKEKEKVNVSNESEETSPKNIVVEDGSEKKIVLDASNELNIDNTPKPLSQEPSLGVEQWLTAAIVEDRLRKIPALPKKLHVFDCSMANCFGLKILYSYLNVPFLELKKKNLEQALRVLEEEATATDSDLVKLVKNANYDEYLEHLSKKSAPSRSAPQATQSKAPNEESIVPATENNSALTREGQGKQALPRNKIYQSSMKKENYDNPQENRGEVLAMGSTSATETKGNRKAKLEMKHKLMDSAAVAVTVGLNTGLADEEREPTDVEDAIRFLNERRSNNELEAFFSDEEEEDGIKAKEDHSNNQEVGADESMKNRKQKNKRDHHTAADLVGGNTQDEESDDEFYAPQRFGLVDSTPAPTEENTSIVANEDSIPSEDSPKYTSELIEKSGKEPELAEQAEVDEENEDNENEIKAVAEEEAGSKRFDEIGSITVENIGEESTFTNDRAVDNTDFIPMPDDPNIMGDWLDDEGSSGGEFDEQALQTPQEAPMGDETADDEAPVDNSHSIEVGEETLNAKNGHIPLNPENDTDKYSNASGDSDAVTDQGSDNSAENLPQKTKRSMHRQDTDRDVRTEATVSSAALAAIQAAKIAAEEWEAETPPMNDDARGKERKKKKKKEKRKDENGIGSEKVKKKKESKKNRKSKET